MVYPSCSTKFLSSTLAFQSPITLLSNSAARTRSVIPPATVATAIKDPLGILDPRWQVHSVGCRRGATSNESAMHSHRRRRRTTLSWTLQASSSQDDENNEEDITAKHKKKHTKQQNQAEEEEERELFEEELAHSESLKEILEELEALGGMEDDEDDEDNDYFVDDWDEQSLEEFFESLPVEYDGYDDDDDDDETYLDIAASSNIKSRLMRQKQQQQSASLLENALMQGVVPANAGVGSNILPGDYDFDPLNLASKDYFPKAQAFVKRIIPAKDNGDDSEDSAGEELAPRPQALILRDYREAEIRHGRLPMLAATFWPLQELTDRFILGDDKFESLLHSLFFGGVTLPYFPLLMTAIMLLLGYLDIYSQAIKDMDKIGEAFLPGDCFWDPLQVLTGAPDQMKRNMQERELFNGRFAMLAIAVFIWEEARTGKPLVSIEGNEILFEPAYQVPFIQKWLDSRFSSPSPVFFNFGEESVSAYTSTELLLSTIGDSFHLTLN